MTWKRRYGACTASQRYCHCPTIVYYNIYNIRFVNLHKISRAFCAIFYIDFSGVLRIMKAYRAKQRHGTKRRLYLDKWITWEAPLSWWRQYCDASGQNNQKTGGHKNFARYAARIVRIYQTCIWYDIQGRFSQAFFTR